MSRSGSTLAHDHYQEELRAREHNLKKLREEVANLQFMLGLNEISAHEKNGIQQNYLSLQAQIRTLEMQMHSIAASMPAPSSAPIRGSLAAIQAGLGSASASAAKAPIAKQQAQPIRIFTDEEKEKINEHYEALPEHLKKIMEAAIYDIDTLGVITQPVFIRGEGHVYEENFVTRWLGDAEEKRTPKDQDLTFTKQHITPCNSLIRALQIFLTVIDGAQNAGEESKQEAASEKDNLKRIRISAEQVQLIERIYETLNPVRKALFDNICRDPRTKQIMDDPVLLPDGFACDRSTAAYLLAHGGRCFMNPDISFTEADITPCHFVIPVLDQLKESANLLVANMQAKDQVPLNDIGLEQHRLALIQNIESLRAKIQNIDEANKNKVNQDMDIVLQAATKALKLVRPELLQEAKKSSPKYDKVVTLLGGEKDSTTWWGRLYRGVAKKMGTINGQPGVLVAKILKETEATLESFVVAAHKQSLSHSSYK